MTTTQKDGRLQLPLGVHRLLPSDIVRDVFSLGWQHKVMLLFVPAGRVPNNARHHELAIAPAANPVHFFSKVLSNQCSVTCG